MSDHEQPRTVPHPGEEPATRAPLQTEAGTKGRYLALFKYTSFTLFMLLVFLYLTFPFQHLGGMLRKEVRKKTAWDLTIADLDSHLFTGLEVSKLTLADTKKGGQLRPLLDLGPTTIWINPLTMLWGKTSISLDTTAGKGGMSGTIGLHGSSIDLDLVLENLDLVHLPIVGSFLDKNFTGKLAGSVEVSLDKEHLDSTSGMVHLQGKEVTLDESTITTQMGPLTMPKMTFATVDIKVFASDGSIQFKEFSFNGEDLTLIVTGKIELKRQWQSSKVTLDLKLKLGEVLASKYDIIFQQTPKSEGFYHLDLVGSLGNPRCPQLGF
ncbi:MAG: type II secretion system protein GspN [Deltaproteobacteria bacterium RIFOXYA12_FULL_61_11]|nr:MAG: type II secretion system protein GspN [Deltaproteobacteria bacterium RIFOXYA12_FULL_61_11]